MDKEYKKFKANLAKSKTEEDVKNAYAKHFEIQYDTSDRHDLYTRQVLFEFKYDKNMDNLKTRASVLAQVLYYVHRLKFGHTQKAIPVYLCLADKNQVIIVQTSQWKQYYSNIDDFDWDLAASIPDKHLVEKLAKDKELRKLHIFKLDNERDYEIFHEKLRNCLDPQQKLALPDKKVITEENFEEIFDYWNGIFGISVKNGFKTSKYFVCDIQEGRTHLIREQGKVFFDFGAGDGRTKKILLKDYEFFWEIYEKVISADTMRGILSKIDRISSEEMRRFHGEFFTPIRFAQKALEYIEKTLGKSWWKSGEYRIWDMASGTGNLEWHLPNAAYQYLYLSTLYPSEAEHCQKLFPNATVFQYDYLNDDVTNVFANGGLDFKYTWKLPEKLRNDLANPKIKWLILINPPFATAATAVKKGNKKEGVSDTKLRKIMHSAELGEVSRELFSQFIFRVKKEFTGKEAHLAIFSTPKYIDANNDQKFRDKVFDFKFKSGFVFASGNFSGTSKSVQFPIAMIIWELNQGLKIEKQKIKLAVFNENVEKIGKKTIKSIHRSKLLSKWISRPANTLKFPPLGAAISVKDKNKDRRDRIAKGFLASLRISGNTFHSQSAIYLLSAPSVSAGGVSVTSKNFEEAMVIHAVMHIPKRTWLNNRDQFLQPKQKLAQEFINDCTIWNLFSNSNQTAAISDVEYEKNVYQIQNHFFPFLLKEIKKWKITDSDYSLALASAENRFVAEYLAKAKLSKEAKEVLEVGKEIYKYYFSNLHQLRTDLFKIKTWDAGFWQIRKVVQDQDLAEDLFKKLKEKQAILRNKILPQIYAYEFISKIEI